MGRQPSLCQMPYKHRCFLPEKLQKLKLDFLNLCLIMDIPDLELNLSTMQLGSLFIF